MPAQNAAGEPDKNKKFHEQSLLTSKARSRGLFFVRLPLSRPIFPWFCRAAHNPAR
jgi:hypothetical protein